MSQYNHASENLVVNHVALAAAINFEAGSASMMSNDMVSRNPAPNSSPTSAPSGAHRQYKMCNAE